YRIAVPNWNAPSNLIIDLKIIFFYLGLIDVFYKIYIAIIFVSYPSFSFTNCLNYGIKRSTLELLPTLK
ncbi:MAG: hypothetical protein ACI9LL_001066, partial [Porticoccus sp.]